MPHSIYRSSHSSWKTTLVAVALLSTPTMPAYAEPSGAVEQLYWCPEQSPERRIQARQAAGCTPLVEKEEARGTGTQSRTGTEGSREQLEATAESFLKDYRVLMASSPARTGARVEHITELEERAGGLIKDLNESLPASRLKGTPGLAIGLIQHISQARGRLRTLKEWLKQTGESEAGRERENSDTLDAQRRRLREAADHLDQELAPTKELPKARTGAEIGQGSSADSSTRIRPRSTTRQTYTAPTGPDVGNSSTNVRTNSGVDIGNSSLNERAGSGTDVGSAPRTGADIGSSTFNSLIKIGPASGDSTFNTNLP